MGDWNLLGDFLQSWLVGSSTEILECRSRKSAIVIASDSTCESRSSATAIADPEFRAQIEAELRENEYEIITAHLQVSLFFGGYPAKLWRCLFPPSVL